MSDMNIENASKRENINTSPSEESQKLYSDPESTELDLSSLEDCELDISSLSLENGDLHQNSEDCEDRASEHSPESQKVLKDHIEKVSAWNSEHGSDALFRDTVFMMETGTISQENGIMLLKKAATGGCVLSWIYLGKLYSDSESELYNPTLAFESFAAAARLNSGEGHYYLGLCYANGIGCTPDMRRAEAVFSKGGELDHAECFFALGICRERGIGCEIDYPMAVKLYEYGAKLGSADATNTLGGCYFHGHGVAQDKSRAFELYNKAAEMGNSNARCRLGICYELGDGCECNHAKALEHYIAAAEAGNAIALYRVALCYDRGIGVEQNFAQAFKYYNLSAKAGYAPAMHESGLMSKNGRGTRKSSSAAYNMFSLASEAGFSASELELGNCYFEGVGTVRNLEYAFSKYENAYNKDNGNAEAAFKLGLCHLKGLGTKKEPQLAYEWFSKSAELGSRHAAYMKGECNFYGVGTIEDKQLAVKCYEKVASEDGSDEASIKSFLALARCFEQAAGVAKDIDSALVLYKKAAEFGDAEAMYSAGRIIMSGAVNSLEQPSARGFILRSARNAYIPAMLAMGIFADEGRGVTKNPIDAEKWYTRAVNSETKNIPELYDFPERFQDKIRFVSDSKIEAQYRLGMILAHNDPSLKSYIQAFEYVAAAASMGHDDAQLEISRIYVHGGDLKNYYESAANMSDAAFENNDTLPSKEILGNAMNKLGDAYFDGKSLVEKNKSAATRCYKIAAESGHVDAAYSYGWCLRHGSGVRENDVEAVKWLKIAADKGNANAAYSYGLCCEEGAGTGIKNKREARSYYRKAAAAGHADAAKRYISLSE